MIRSKKCKICGSESDEAFRIPASKLTGHDIPDSDDNCFYYECTRCKFCFTDIHDKRSTTEIYDQEYWDTQDPDWYGRVNESMRLVLLSNMLINKKPWEIDILDFGCGMGTFVETAREKLGMNVWGHDIIEPKFGRKFFDRDLRTRQYDMIVCCEVLEHLPFPLEVLSDAARSLKPDGVLAFQTAYYDPHACGRDWWYVGPANGHVSFYSVGALDKLFNLLGGVSRVLWNNYPGVQAWQIHPRTAPG